MLLGLLVDSKAIMIIIIIIIIITLVIIMSLIVLCRSKPGRVFSGFGVSLYR